MFIPVVVHNWLNWVTFWPHNVSYWFQIVEQVNIFILSFSVPSEKTKHDSISKVRVELRTDVGTEDSTARRGVKRVCKFFMALSCRLLGIQFCLLFYSLMTCAYLSWSYQRSPLWAVFWAVFFSEYNFCQGQPDSWLTIALLIWRDFTLLHLL